MPRAVAANQASPSKRPRPEPARAKAADASNSTAHDLEQALPYLLARAGVRMGQAFTHELKPFNLTLAEWRILASLLHKAHQRLAELAEHTSAEPSTLSRTVDALVLRGLLARERSSTDGRAVALSLTAEGHDPAARIVPLAQLYERIAVAGIPSAHIALLKETLRKIYVNMDTLDSGR